MDHERRGPRPSLLAAAAVVAWLVVGMGGGVVLGQGAGSTSPIPSVASAGPAASPPARPPVTSRDGIEVPTEAIKPYIQCLLDAGEYIAEVHQPPVPGATPFFVLGITTDEETAFARAHACRRSTRPSGRRPKRRSGRSTPGGSTSASASSVSGISPRNRHLRRPSSSNGRQAHGCPSTAPTTPTGATRSSGPPRSNAALRCMTADPRVLSAGVSPEADPEMRETPTASACFHRLKRPRTALA